MSNTPINQHYIPQFYLRGFTESDSKDSQIWVYDIKNSKSFCTNPKNIGSRRYFNKIDLKGIPPDELEKKLSELADTPCTHSIRQIEATREFKGENRKNILNLIALMGVRTPFNREYYNNSDEYLAKIALSHLAAAEEGTKINGTIVTKELKEFIKSEQYKIEFPRNWEIQRELSILNPIINLLSHRKWTLVFAPDEYFFITCDQPVSLYSKTPDNRVHFSGFGLSNRQLFFPISKKMALIGDFEEEEQIFTASIQMVAGINSKILMAAKSQVYAPNSQFYFKSSQEKIVNGVESLQNFS